MTVLEAFQRIIFEGSLLLIAKTSIGAARMAHVVPPEAALGVQRPTLKPSHHALDQRPYKGHIGLFISLQAAARFQLTRCPGSEFISLTE